MWKRAALSQFELSVSPSLTFAFSYILKGKTIWSFLFLQSTCKTVKAVECPDRPLCDFSELYNNYVWVGLSLEAWNIFYLLSTCDCSIKGNTGDKQLLQDTFFFQSKCLFVTIAMPVRLYVLAQHMCSLHWQQWQVCHPTIFIPDRGADFSFPTSDCRFYELKWQLSRADFISCNINSMSLLKTLSLANFLMFQLTRFQMRILYTGLKHALDGYITLKDRG